MNIRTKWKWPLLLVTLSNRFFLSFACHNSQASLAQREGSSRIGRSREATELCSDESGAAEVESSEEPKTEECLLS